MHFEENELSPSLIGLSPLPTTHPMILQHHAVRSSTWSYPRFNLVMGRSPGFASAPSDSGALFGLAFATAWALKALTLPDEEQLVGSLCKRHAVTLIRRSGLRPLVSVWFQVLFHSPVRRSFHLSLTVLVHYRS